jgi:phosphate transport system substrate-binding protein
MKKSWALIVGMVIAAAIIVAWDFVQAQSSTRHVIRVRGADSVAGRVDKLAKIYMKDHSDFFILVSGGSKSMGLDGLMDQTCEVAMAPRKITDAERREAAAKGVDLVERLIGYGAIAMVVNAGNPVSELTVEQVQKVLKGEYTRWNQVGGPDEPIELFAPGEIHAGTLFFIRNDLLGGAPLASSSQSVGSFENVIRRVGATKGGFGFTRVRDALESPATDDVEFKVLAIKQNADSPAVKLSRKAIADGAYPIKRPFFLYFDRKASSQVKEFVDFVVNKGWGPQRIE